MATIGCTLIQKSWGDQANWLGRWDRLKHPVRPPGKYVPSLQFGRDGDLVEAIVPGVGSVSNRVRRT